MEITNINTALDRKQFEQIFNEYFSQLINFSKFYVKDTDSAKEIVQNVFINLWQKKESIDSNKSIKSYLFTSVKNRSLNYIRDNKKYKSEYLDIEIEKHNTFFEVDILTSNELQEKISKSINSLPEKCRIVFEMSRFEELKYQEIADKLQISIKTVENQMSKALKVLRADLKEYLPILILFGITIGVK